MLALSLVALTGLAAGAANAGERGRFAYSISITGEIDVESERGLKSSIASATSDGATALIVRLDTPGGDADSTRTMVEDIIAAPMPVIVYVHPSGGHAGSAGLFLTLAGDVAAMAPATNIGSATPVRDGPPPADEDERRLLRTLDRKFLNDSVAFARSLAEDHGRNGALAERMIRRADNVSSTRALRQRLVDVVAPTETALLRAIDGMPIKGRKARRLRTAGMTIRRVDLSTAELFADDVERSSYGRSLLLVFGAALTGLLVVLGAKRGPRAYRRRMRRRRARARRASRE